jgi:hypothetical protein
MATLNLSLTHWVNDLANNMWHVQRWQDGTDELNSTENNTRRYLGKLKTISHHNAAEKPFEVGVSGWGLYPVFQHVWHRFPSNGYRTHDTRAVQTSASLIDRGCRTSKLSGRDMFITCSVFTVWFQGYGFVSHQESLLQNYRMAYHRWRGR